MKIVSAPNQHWRPGSPIESPVLETIAFDPTDLDTKGCYKFLSSTILPRPIAFVTTLSANDTVNVAPFSFFNGVSSNPPAVMFSIGFKSDGTKKDTLRNIEDRKEFVVNTVAEWMVAPMDHCSAEYPYGVSEVDLVGLTTLPSLVVAPPRIKESPVHFECQLISMHQIGKEEAGGATVVIGEVVQFHICKQAWNQGRILSGELRAVGRIGGAQYSLVENAFELPRPSREARHSGDGHSPHVRKP